MVRGFCAVLAVLTYLDLRHLTTQIVVLGVASVLCVFAAFTTNRMLPPR